MKLRKNKILFLWERKNKRSIIFHFLKFLSLIYFLGYAIRKLLYSIKMFKIRELQIKVISVGNITSGGSGKTPFVLYLSKKLQEKKINFAILTRGYKRKSKGTKVLIGESSPEIRWQEVGDEPFLLNQYLPEIPVIVDKDRYRSGKIAIDRYKSELVVLDDGFQHWRLKKDMDILLIDASVDLEKERLLPAGRLREPLSSLQRGKIFVLNRTDQSVYKDKIKTLLQKINPGAPIVESILKVKTVVDWNNETKVEPGFLKGKKGVSFCGIGNPFSFEKTLKSLGVEILKAFFFLDHYIYTEEDLFSLEEEGKKSDADFLFATEKDSVRLPEKKEWKIPLLVVKVELKITSGEEKLWEILSF